VAKSAPSARRAANDPLGRRALFWLPPDQGDPGAPTEADPPRGARPPLGKHALFSTARAALDDEEPEGSDNPLADRGPVAVECERCGTRSRIGYLDLLIYQLPFGYWLPRGKFDRRMTCPACRQRTWASVSRWRT
jgi:hypothetical protein